MSLALYLLLTKHRENSNMCDIVPMSKLEVHAMDVVCGVLKFSHRCEDCGQHVDIKHILPARRSLITQRHTVSNYEYDLILTLPQV